MKEKCLRLCRLDWFAALILLAVFLLTNGYIYSWDDQHVEIPLLKRLIDPGLYPGDYYVDSLASNFPSYFYHLLAKFISTDQVPTAYLLLYLISRYFLFFWTYKLWKIISTDRLSAFLCGLNIILLIRVEEFLYRTFSHQEFALAIVIAGMYFFYRERFLLAAVVWGTASNVHAIYSLFPMVYLCIYLLWQGGKKKWENLAKAILGFSICALPVVWRIGQKWHNTALPTDSPLLAGWLELYKIACPQNFIFLNIPLEAIFGSMKNFLDATSKLLFVIGLYALNLRFNPKFRQDKRAQSIALATFVLMTISFIFTYIWPSRFILDLNLVRNIQFLLFILAGYTMLLLIEQVNREKIRIAVLIALMFSLLRYADIVSLFAVLFIYILFMIQRTDRQKLKFIIFINTLVLLALAIIYNLTFGFYSLSSKVVAITIVVALAAYWLLEENKKHWLAGWPGRQKLILFIPLAVIFVNFCIFHIRYTHIVREGPGLWQLQRNWEDMQRYVKEHTPRNAIILAPNDTEMGGFRVWSERTIIVCYRDCGIIGFDFKAAREWENRLKDIETFQVYVRRPIESALANALFKYKVNYIVFMRYAEPGENVPAFEKIYENEVFSFYRVRANPVGPEIP